MKNILLIALLIIFPTWLLGKTHLKNNKQVENDRQYWCDLLYKMVEPVLSNMSRGQLSTE